jgi:hypothetical protein
LDGTSSTKRKTISNISKTILSNIKPSKLTLFTYDGMKWLSIMLLHCATIPSILGLIFAISNSLPSFDVVFFIWTSLLIFFIQALIKKDILTIATVGIGFFIQAILLGMVVFK